MWMRWCFAWHTEEMKAHGTCCRDINHLLTDSDHSHSLKERVTVVPAVLDTTKTVKGCCTGCYILYSRDTGSCHCPMVLDCVSVRQTDTQSVYLSACWLYVYVAVNQTDRPRRSSSVTEELCGRNAWPLFVEFCYINFVTENISLLELYSMLSSVPRVLITGNASGFNKGCGVSYATHHRM